MRELLANEVDRIVRESLRDNFRLYEDSHKVRISNLADGDICIGYRTNGELLSELKGTTHFDAQIIGDICYLLYIELEESFRGKGIGWGLYESVHDFSRKFEMGRVRQTPSGMTATGDTRDDYLLKRGYISAEGTQGELDFVFNR